MRIGASATNLFNHPNYGVPNLSLGTAGFGTISSLQSAEDTGPRAIQLGGRITFSEEACGAVTKRTNVQGAAMLRKWELSHGSRLLARESYQIRRDIAIQIQQLARRQSRCVKDFKRRSRAVKIQLLSVAADPELERRPGFEGLRLDHLVGLQIPNPPFGSAIAAGIVEHHRIAELAVWAHHEAEHRKVAPIGV